MSRLLEAIKFATVKHQNQIRKNTSAHPYVVHPIEVCQLLSLCNIADENVLIAAVLHDVLEDTDTTYQEIESKFGTAVANIVKECTDDKSVSKIERKRLQIEHVRVASHEAKLVKLADKLSNLSNLLDDPPTSWSEDEINGYAIWCMFVCEAAGTVCYSLQQALSIVFTAFDLTKLTEDEKLQRLEKYYSNIDKSE